MIIVIYFEFSLLADVFVGGDTAQINFLGRFLREQRIFMSWNYMKKNRTLRSMKKFSFHMGMLLHPLCSPADTEAFIDC